MEMILDALFDAVLDTAKLIPFLLITYMGMEYLEHKAEKHTTGMLEKAGHFGPLIGAAVGILPQCGFSAAASSLFAGGVISVGTLIAVFLSTSDADFYLGGCTSGDDAAGSGDEGDPGPHQWFPARRLHAAWPPYEGTGEAYSRSLCA